MTRILPRMHLAYTSMSKCSIRSWLRCLHCHGNYDAKNNVSDLKKQTAAEMFYIKRISIELPLSVVYLQSSFIGPLQKQLGVNSTRRLLWRNSKSTMIFVSVRCSRRRPSIFMIYLCGIWPAFLLGLLTWYSWLSYPYKHEYEFSLLFNAVWPTTGYRILVILEHAWTRSDLHMTHMWMWNPHCLHVATNGIFVESTWPPWCPVWCEINQIFYGILHPIDILLTPQS